MKLMISCFECAKEGSKTQEDALNSISLVEFNDDGKFETTCPLGHKSTTILQQLRYETLFEIGAHAIIDGYYREAVTSFSSSLERFYEFCVRVLMQANKVPYEIVSDVWKTNVSKQSERQLGAFIFLWTYVFKNAPTTLAEDDAGFRNKVVHQGKIPTKPQAIEYGEKIYNLVINSTNQLRDACMKEMRSIRMTKIYKPSHGLDLTGPYSSMSISSILDPVCERDRENPESFKRILKYIEKNNTQMKELQTQLSSKESDIP